MLCRVMLRCFFGMMSRLHVVTMGYMGMMTRLSVVTSLMVFGGFTMMLRCVVVMLGCLLVMLGCLLMTSGILSCSHDGLRSRTKVVTYATNSHKSD